MWGQKPHGKERKEHNIAILFPESCKHGSDPTCADKRTASLELASSPTANSDLVRASFGHQSPGPPRYPRPWPSSQTHGSEGTCFVLWRSRPAETLYSYRLGFHSKAYSVLTDLAQLGSTTKLRTRSTEVLGSELALFVLKTVPNVAALEADVNVASQCIAPT